MSIRTIAASIDKTSSTISREIKKNGDCFRYYAELAHHRAKSSSKKGYSKIEANTKLRAYIIDKLGEKWSPKVIAGRLKLENPGQNISAESIYEWIYSDSVNDLKLYELLPRRKPKRGMFKTRPSKRSQNKISIHARPPGNQ